jgi:hypothetical protein
MKRTFAVAVILVALAAIAPGYAAADGFGITGVDSSFLDGTGEPLLSAGSHADFTTSIHLATVTNGEGTVVPAGNPKDIEATLPAGVIGNPTTTEKCTQEEFVELVTNTNCSPNTQVGIAAVELYLGGPIELEVPLYNLEAPPGVPAQLAFAVGQTFVYLNASVTADGEYRLKASTIGLAQTLAIGDNAITIWGVPGASSHDLQRSLRNEYGDQPPNGTPIPFVGPKLPFMSNPTACTGEPLRTDVRADSWQEPGVFSEKSGDTDPNGAPLVITGCDQVPFEASMEAQPTTTAADSPSGLNVDVKLPQNQLPGGRSDSALREAVVTLPEGMVINPSSVGGLGSCSQDQIGLGNDNGPSCPASSKIGTLRAVTPVLDHPLDGSVYLAQQGKNKFGSLLALYLVVEDPADGVLVKIPGKVETDPQTGRVVTRVSDAPQLPVSDLQVSLFSGPRAPLITPPTCGTYSTTGAFSPWSGTATIDSSDSFKVSSGPNGSACSNGGFDPGLRAASANASAGQFSPFEAEFTRPDGSQRLSSIALQLPEGLLARLAGVPYCPDAAIAAIPTAEGTGAGEISAPSCPAASRVGSLSVAAGAGASPFWDKSGAIYLAGPYKGAPLSLAFVAPAVAGPFDLGNVTTRAALNVDPVTTVASATSDPLPTILDGIPLDLRDVWVQIDRPGFTVNPTACAAQQVTSTVVSTTGTSAHPSQAYRATGCAGLGFSPKLAIKLGGAVKRSGFPALTANLSPPPGQANFARAVVALPRSEFLEQSHIKTVCTRVQFAAQQCPAASVYGYAEAKTPLLDKPLRGPVYLRSSSHQLPDLVAALRGQVEIDLDGRIDSHKGGIRVSFEGLPDAPIEAFKLSMRGGKKGLLVNSVALCGGPAKKASAAFTGQNGRHADSSIPVRAACPHPKRR